MEIKITRELFNDYLKIQHEGKYNMITDCSTVKQLLGCTEEQYLIIISEYSNLLNLFDSKKKAELVVYSYEKPEVTSCTI